MADETDYQDEPRHEEQEQGGSDNEVCKTGPEPQSKH